MIRTNPPIELLLCPRCGGPQGTPYAGSNSHNTFGYICPCGFEGYGGHPYAPDSEARKGWNEAVAGYQRAAALAHGAGI